MTLCEWLELNMLCKCKYLTFHFSLLVSHWTRRAVPWVKVLFDPSSHPNLLHLCHTKSQITTATRGRSPTININIGCATTYAIHRLCIYVCTTHMIVQHKAETEALGRFGKADVEPDEPICQYIGTQGLCPALTCCSCPSLSYIIL